MRIPTSAAVLLAYNAVLLTSKSTYDPNLNYKLGKVIQNCDLYTHRSKPGCFCACKWNISAFIVFYSKQGQYICNKLKYYSLKSSFTCPWDIQIVSNPVKECTGCACKHICCLRCCQRVMDELWGRLNAAQCAVTGESGGSLLHAAFLSVSRRHEAPLSGAALQSPFRSPLFSAINVELQGWKALWALWEEFY